MNLQQKFRAWYRLREADRFRIGPTLAVGATKDQFRDEVWRIARFVAYSDFVSITKNSDEGFTIVSIREGGTGFEIILQVMPIHLANHRPRPFTDEEETAQA